MLAVIVTEHPTQAGWGESLVSYYRYTTNGIAALVYRPAMRHTLRLFGCRWLGTPIQFSDVTELCGGDALSELVHTLHFAGSWFLWSEEQAPGVGKRWLVCKEGVGLYVARTLRQSAPLCSASHVTFLQLCLTGVGSNSLRGTLLPVRRAFYFYFFVNK